MKKVSLSLGFVRLASSSRYLVVFKKNQGHLGTSKGLVDAGMVWVGGARNRLDSGFKCFTYQLDPHMCVLFASWVFMIDSNIPRLTQLVTYHIYNIPTDITD